MRWRVDPRVWPVLLLGVLLGPACMAYRSIDAEIVNASSRTVRVEFSSKADDDLEEKVSAQLAPGGTFRRELYWAGLEVFARATVEGGDCPYGPIPIEFQDRSQIWVVRDEGAGIGVFPRARPTPEGATCGPR